MALQQLAGLRADGTWVPMATVHFAAVIAALLAGWMAVRAKNQTPAEKRFGMLRRAQHERKNSNDIHISPFALSIVEGLLDHAVRPTYAVSSRKVRQPVYVSAIIELTFWAFNGLVPKLGTRYPRLCELSR